MSTKILNLAWDADLPLARKMVLVALADQANDHGEAYPGLTSMQRRCSMARATLYASLAELEADGWISRETFGGARKTLYRINVARLTQAPLLPADGPANGPSSSRTVQQPDRPAQRPSSCGNSDGPAGGHIKATKSKATGVCSERTRDEQLEVMGAFDRALIAPFLHDLPASVEVQLFADFVKHVQVKRGPFSVSSWLQLRQHLNQLATDGVDLNQSLRETMLAQLVIPVDPRKKANRGGAPPNRPSVRDDFTNAHYEGTPDDQLPAELRVAAELADTD